MLPHEESLLTDQQLRDASIDQIEDLVQRINLMLKQRELPGALVWRQEAYDDEEERPPDHTPDWTDHDVSDPGVSL